jgi:hypothetical protein
MVHVCAPAAAVAALGVGVEVAVAVCVGAALEAVGAAPPQAARTSANAPSARVAERIVVIESRTRVTEAKGESMRSA